MSDWPPWLSAVIGIFGGGTVGTIVGAAAKSRRAREESATAVVPHLRQIVAEMREEVRSTRAELGAVQAARSRDRDDYELALSGLQADMHDAIRASDERCRQLREQDREECRQETLDAVRSATEPLYAELARIAAHAADTRRHARGADDTGVHELEETAARAARRSPTPLPIARVEIGPAKKNNDR